MKELREFIIYSAESGSHKSAFVEIEGEDNDKMYTAGVSFKVISNEDRLRLNEIIEYHRSESSAYQRKVNKIQP